MADVLIEKGINKFILLCDNVLNFHGSDDCYYEKWWDDTKGMRAAGFVWSNSFDHVATEMKGQDCNTTPILVRYLMM